MKRLRSEEGVALLVVMLLALTALVTTACLLYLVGIGGYLSGQQKRFHTALEAGRGGIDVIRQVIADRGATDNTLYTNFVLGPNLALKLTTSTDSWGAGVDNSTTIDPDNDNTYDVRFDIGGYRVYSKIVDTVQGNSGPATGLITGGTVSTGSGEVTVMSVPYLYTIEELAQSATNPSERAKFTVLYEY